MKVEDIDLLSKDLCGRSPYGVKCVAISDGYIGCISSVEFQYGVVTFDDGRQEEVVDIKPYLFPLSSMTEEQYEYFTQDLHAYITFNGVVGTQMALDWLNAHHFDNRGLIEKGLAIDATGLNIYKEETI